MSTAESIDQPTSPFASDSTSKSSWSFVDAIANRVGDTLNPILVKEARQALKSRQFTASFWLILLFAVGWSFVGISLLMPRVYYFPSGRFMITGYFLIFCIPLLLIVPFSAFRSLATEREDGTYELLSITSLSARQIVTGKLGSALMQMLVYYAALAPCIAFTYLLRGLDVGTIFLLLAGTFLMSILFSCIGLVFAGMSRARAWQALTSVLLLIILLIGGIYWCVFMMIIVHSGEVPINTVDFWIGVAFTITIYSTLVALLVLVAAAQNSFASDNRSTKIRWVMLGQLVLFAGWMVFFWVRYQTAEVSEVALVFAGIAFAMYGMLLTGEIAELSPRARRDLPQSWFGRIFLTWFNPGSGTGYVFTLTAFGSFVALFLLMNAYASANYPEIAHPRIDRLNVFGILVWSYMALYLGLGRMIVIGLRRIASFGLPAVFLIHALVLVASSAIPTFLQFWLQKFRSADYSDVQMLNWAWSLTEALTGRWIMGPTVFVVGGLGVCMYFLNLVLAAREVEASHLPTPKRVAIDDAKIETEKKTAVADAFPTT